MVCHSIARTAMADDIEKIIIHLKCGICMASLRNQPPAMTVLGLPSTIAPCGWVYIMLR
jgi:hypothetical protein